MYDRLLQEALPFQQTSHASDNACRRARWSRSQTSTSLTKPSACCNGQHRSLQAHQAVMQSQGPSACPPHLAASTRTAWMQPCASWRACSAVPAPSACTGPAMPLPEHDIHRLDIPHTMAACLPCSSGTELPQDSTTRMILYVTCFPPSLVRPSRQLCRWTVHMHAD